MRKMLGAALAAGALSVAGAAEAAVVVPFSGEPPDETGMGYPQMDQTKLATAGQQSLYAVIRWNVGELIGAWAGGYHDTTFGYYDPTWPGDVGYNESEYMIDCSLASGCVKLARPGMAYAKLDLPAEYDRTPCSPSDFYCYQRLNASYVSFDFAFRTQNGEIASGTVTFQDHAPIPEPATWAMMIAGFGLAGARLRHRRPATA